MNKNEKGKRGEDAACKYLLEKGYSIIKRNYRKKSGEIDIIAVCNNSLVFIEVKAWAKVPFDEAGFSINSAKMKKIINTAKQYIFDNNEAVLNMDIRFDFIFINALGGNIVHSQNVFAEV